MSISTISWCSKPHLTVNPSSQASKTLGTPSSSSSDGAGAPGAVEENLQTSWSAASQSPQPPRPQPQLPAWRQLCEARSTRCSWWSWCFPRVHLSLGQFLGISWILTMLRSPTSKRLRLPRFKGVLWLPGSSFSDLPILSHQAFAEQVFSTLPTWVPRKMAQMPCRLVKKISLLVGSAFSICSWAFPDVDDHIFLKVGDVPFKPILRMVILMFPSLMGSSHPLPERASLGPPRWNAAAEFRRLRPWWSRQENHGVMADLNVENWWIYMNLWDHLVIQWWKTYKNMVDFAVDLVRIHGGRFNGGWMVNFMVKSNRFHRWCIGDASHGGLIDGGWRFNYWLT